MFVKQTAFLASLLVAASVSAAEKQPLDAAKLIGKWQSVKFEGKDKQPGIIKLEMEFGEDGQLTLQATAKIEGEVKMAKRQFAYKVTKNELEMTINGRAKRTNAWFEKGQFVTSEPRVDFRVYFERVKPKE